MEALVALLLAGGALYGASQSHHRKRGNRYKESIRGGLASGRRPSDFNKVQLARGTKVEREHTTSKRVAREIAMDHLTEDPHYYRKLAKMERGR